jgi:hypothetical protein
MHETNRIALAVVLSIASIFIAASPSFGAVITYTEEATASGSLDGITFTDATVVLKMVNNTSNVTNLGGGDFLNLGTATVSINGGTAVTFTDPIQVVLDQSDTTAGFEDTSVDDILDVDNASFATYALTTSIGPLPGSSTINVGSSYGTTGGAFTLTSAEDATFTAAVVPEPSTWAMMLIGFAGLGYAGYRRARAAHATSLAA